MKRNFIAILTVCGAALLLSAETPGATGQEIAEALAESGTGLSAENGMLSMETDSDAEFYEIIGEALARTYRTVGVSALSDGFWHTGDTRYVRAEEINDIASEDAFALEWAREKARELIPDGLTKEETLEKLYLFVINNFDYDFEAYEIGGTGTPTAAAAIRDGKGTCRPLSLLFRALVESVPFGDGGLSDWEGGTPGLKVALVSNGSHVWDAVLLEGEWRFYDCSQTADGCLARCGMDMGTVTGKYAADYGDPSSWAWSY